MQKFSGYFAWVVILLYFVLGIYILMSPRFNSLSREVKIIFAVFLFLYGAFRMARIWTKNRERDEE
jgi:hypothetical protein